MTRALARRAPGYQGGAILRLSVVLQAWPGRVSHGSSGVADALPVPVIILSP
jgi:hypothetical protein